MKPVGHGGAGLPTANQSVSSPLALQNQACRPEGDSVSVAYSVCLLSLPFQSPFILMAASEGPAQPCAEKLPKKWPVHVASIQGTGPSRHQTVLYHGRRYSLLTPAGLVPWSMRIQSPCHSCLSRCHCRCYSSCINLQPLSRPGKPLALQLSWGRV